MYELLVGEIGLPRHEFLYDIQFWEARRIVAGHIKQRQARLSDLRLMTSRKTESPMLMIFARFLGTTKKQPETMIFHLTKKLKR